MKINYFLTTQSFDRTNYKSLFGALCGMFSDIKGLEAYFDENRFFICRDVLLLKVDGGMTLLELSCSSAIPSNVRYAISTILDMTSHNSKYLQISESSSVDVIEYTSNNDEQECTAIIADESAPLDDKNYGPVYNQKTCIDLRRKYWGYYINDTGKYLQQCRKYYTNLFFLPNVDETIDSIYNDCKKQITQALSSLNDVYYPYYQGLGLNIVSQQEQMSWLKSKCDIDVCPQGKKKKKLKAEFSFPGDEGKSIVLFCGLHVKFDYTDKGTTFSNDRRLHFHEPHSKVLKSKKVLIAHIGGHLEQKGYKK